MLRLIRCGVVLGFLAGLFVATHGARAAVFYGDMAGNSIGSGFGVGTSVNSYVAEGFTMTGNYNLQSVDINLSGFTPQAGSNIALSIFSNAAGNVPSATDLYDLSTNIVIANSGPPTNVNLSGSGSFPLTSGTTYWLELYATNPSSSTGTTVQWDGEFTPASVFAVPQGPGATEVGQNREFSGGTTTSELRTSFQLNGVLAPEPSSALLAALGFLGCLTAARRRRAN